MLTNTDACMDVLMDTRAPRLMMSVMSHRHKLWWDQIPHTDTRRHQTITWPHEALVECCCGTPGPDRRSWPPTGSDPRVELGCQNLREFTESGSIRSEEASSKKSADVSQFMLEDVELVKCWMKRPQRDKLQPGSWRGVFTYKCHLKLWAHSQNKNIYELLFWKSNITLCSAGSSQSAVVIPTFRSLRLRLMMIQSATFSLLVHIKR